MFQEPFFSFSFLIWDTLKLTQVSSPKKKWRITGGLKLWIEVKIDMWEPQLGPDYVAEAHSGNLKQKSPFLFSQKTQNSPNAQHRLRRQRSTLWGGISTALSSNLASALTILYSSHVFLLLKWELWLLVPWGGASAQPQVWISALPPPERMWKEKLITFFIKKWK